MIILHLVIGFWVDDDPLVVEVVLPVLLLVLSTHEVTKAGLLSVEIKSMLKPFSGWHLAIGHKNRELICTWKFFYYPVMIKKKKSTNLKLTFANKK